MCLDWRSGDKNSDLVVRDMLLELSQMYVEETAGNPFFVRLGRKWKRGGPDIVPGQGAATEDLRVVDRA